MGNGRVLLCSSGGGLPGLETHTGVIQAIEQIGLRITDYMGASAGAMINTLHASDYSGNIIETILRTQKPDNLFSRRWFWPFLSYIYNRKGTKTLLKNLLNSRVIGNSLCALTSEDKKQLYYAPGCVDVCLGSSAIPVIFNKQYINMPTYIPKGYYVDGGVCNNIPTPKMKDKDKYDLIIISIACDDIEDSKKPKTKIENAIESFNATMVREYQQVLCDWNDFSNVVIIKPSNYPCSLLEFSRDYSLIKHSRNEALRIIKSKLDI